MGDWTARVWIPAFLVTDLGFFGYWLLSLTGALPEDWLYTDAGSPLVSAWNLSFLPLDLLVSATGLTAVAMHRRARPAWRGTAAVSLALTVASGLQAVSFWAITGAFDPFWWGVNLWLLLYPLPILTQWALTARDG